MLAQEALLVVLDELLELDASARQVLRRSLERMDEQVALLLSATARQKARLSLSLMDEQ